MAELTLVYGRYTEMLMGVIMVYKPTNITGGGHPVVPWSAGGILHNHGYFPGIPQITYTNSSQKNGKYFWNYGNLHPNTGWWFGTFYFSIIYGIILPIDFHVFSRWLKPRSSSSSSSSSSLSLGMSW